MASAEVPTEAGEGPALVMVHTQLVLSFVRAQPGLHVGGLCFFSSGPLGELPRLPPGVMVVSEEKQA